MLRTLVLSCGNQRLLGGSTHCSRRIWMMTSRRECVLPRQFRRTFVGTTTTTTDMEKTQRIKNDSNKRVTINLYRLLLRWKDTVPKDLPDEVFGCFCPPVHLSAPEQLDPYSTELIYANYRSIDDNDDNLAQFARMVLPKNTKYTRNSLTIPIHSVHDLVNLIRVVFRINSNPPLSPTSKNTGSSAESHRNSDVDMIKKRRNAAFTMYRTLNELCTSQLEPLRQHHEENKRFSDIRKFHVGQVVQHKLDRWRGIVDGWYIKEIKIQQPSSLTSKTYNVVGEDNDTTSQTQASSPSSKKIVVYQVLLDTGDVHSQGWKALETTSHEPELQLVTDPFLTRIHNSLSKEHFDRYCDQTDRFIPNVAMKYQYPLDRPATIDVVISDTASDVDQGILQDSLSNTEAIVVDVLSGEKGGIENANCVESTEIDHEKSASNAHEGTSFIDSDSSLTSPLPPQDVDEVCKTIVSGVQELAEQLMRVLTAECTHSSAAQSCSLIQQMSALLECLVEGGSGLYPSEATFAALPPSPTSDAAYHLKALLSFSNRLEDLVIHRKQILALQGNGKHVEGSDDGSTNCDDKKSSCNVKTNTGLQFFVGQVVRHKIYGFRGVVIAIDPTPSIDTTGWDGLKDIPGADEMPFYQIVPNQSDCKEIFGGERSMRYVCEANLEHCPSRDRNFEVQVESGWIWQPATAYYKAPDLHRFRYGERTSIFDTVELCLNQVYAALNDAQCRSQVGRRKYRTVSSTKLSIANLTTLLGAVNTLEDALVVQETLRNFRMANKNIDLRAWMNEALNKMRRGDENGACAVWEAALQEDPSYAEAWNKLAGCRYMQGMEDLSRHATNRTLELDPTNVGAINGRALLAKNAKDYSGAIKAFRKSLCLDPWNAAASKLSVVIDLKATERKPSTPGKKPLVAVPEQSKALS